MVRRLINWRSRWWHICDKNYIIIIVYSVKQLWHSFYNLNLKIQVNCYLLLYKIGLLYQKQPKRRFLEIIYEDPPAPFKLKYSLFTRIIPTVYSQSKRRVSTTNHIGIRPILQQQVDHLSAVIVVVIHRAGYLERAASTVSGERGIVNFLVSGNCE